MPRDSNGTYTLPSGNPVQAGTKISSSWANNTLADIAAALSESVSIDGSVTPDHLSFDQLGFQKKMGLVGIMDVIRNRTATLLARNDSEVGSISHAGFETPPAHHLLCNGAAVSRTTYSKLFAKIGTTFGSGDGSTTFNLPELRAESIVGWDHGRGIDVGRAMGSWAPGSVGAHTHAVTTDSAGDHTHTASTSVSGGHSHAANSSVAGGHTHTWGGFSNTENTGHLHNFSIGSSAVGDHQHAVARTFSSCYDANQNQLADVTTGFSWGSSWAGDHNHYVSGGTGGVSAGHIHSYTGWAHELGLHTHSVVVYDVGDHTHTISTNPAGQHTHSITLASSGAESRVRNVALMMAIKYE